MEIKGIEAERKSDLQFNFDNMHTWMLYKPRQRHRLPRLQWLLRIYDALERTSCIERLHC